MSFWSDIGDLFTGGGGDSKTNATTAFNKAQVSAMTPEQTYATLHPSSPQGQAFFKRNNAVANSGAVQGAIGAANSGLGGVISGLSYVPNKADQAFATTGLVSSGLSWKQAWDATTSGGTDVNGVHLANVNVGQVAFGNLLHPLASAKTNYLQGNAPGTQQFVHDTQDTWTGRIGSGVIDIAATWYADPTLIAGKVARLSKAASHLQDATDVEGAVGAATKINQGASVDRGVVNPARLISQGGAGLFSKGMEESGQRLFQFVKSTDNGSNVAGRQVLLSRTPETAPVLGLLDQADKISDLDLQRQVKIDILGAAGDSATARQRLVESAPDIARAQQRASLAPEGREALDNLHSALADVDHSNPASVQAASQSWVNSAVSFDTIENRAEIAALHTRSLKNLHTQMEALDNVAASSPLEQAGLTALDRAKANLRNHVAQDFHYQDGVSSRTVRVLHWATNQRFRGTISTDNSIRGNQELMDWMTRAKLKHPDTGENIQLFTGPERQAASIAFLTAKTQEQRRRQIDNLWSTMYAKVGAAHGVDPNAVKALANQSKTIRQGSVQYTTRQLENARTAGDDVVTLDDPHLGTPTRLKAALLETHIANNVSLPDPMEIQTAIRQAKSAPTLGDAVGQRAAQFSNAADHFNNVWRLAVLGRPGLLVRTQVDSQGRALAVMGGTAFVHSALTGLGHITGRNIAKIRNTDDLIQVDATAADLANAERLRDEAARLTQSAEAAERVGRVRRGASSGDVVTPTLDTRGAILRDEHKDTNLPLDADSLAHMTPAAKRARAQLNLDAAEALENRKYDTTRFRQGTQDQTFDLGKGRSIKTRAVTNTQDLSDLSSAEYKGGRPSEALYQTPPKSMDDVLARSYAREQKRLYEDKGKWVTYAPGDQHWSAGWIRAMDQMRNSYTGRKVLELADTSTKDLVTELRRDPRVRAEYAEVRSDNLDFNGWLGRLVNTVAWNAPTKEVRQALITKGHMTPNEVKRMFAKPGDTAATLPQQMYVQGPEFSHAPPEGTKPAGAVRKMVSWLSDVPDSVAARHPVYVERYRQHVTTLAQRELDRTGEQALDAATQAKIEKIAKHRAVQDTQQTFYDTAKFTGAHNSLRYVSPFLGAWQDAMESWARLFYDNPAAAGAFNKVWNAPNRMGLVVDQNGDAVRPGQQSNQSFLVLPMEFSNNFKQSKKMTIRKDSLNSIFQGAQWYTPGVGPLVQIPVQELVAKIYPELGDSNNPIVKSFLPFGTPKTASSGGFLGNLGIDVANTTAPAWARAVYSAFNPQDPNNSEAYLSSVNEQIIAARKSGKPIPPAAELDKKATAAARSAGFVRAISLFGFGVSGQQSTVADFYKRQYDLLQSQSAALHAQGTTPTAAFVKQFPEAAGLQWSLSKSQTGVNATLQAYGAEKDYSKQIKANPTFGWFYVGADNLTGQFSQSVYNAQSSRTIGIAGSGAERQRQSRSQVINSSLAEDGWLKYNSLQSAISDALKARGLTSINQKDAAPIQAAKAAAVAALRAQNPAWASDFDDQDQGKLQRFIESVATPAVTDPALKNRPDIQLLGQYLQMRQAALTALNSKGLKSLTSDAAAPLRAALDVAGQALAAQNLGFQQMWTRMFSSEVQSATQKAA